MADIAMCKGTDCPLKNECKRFASIPDEYWQSWFTEIPFDHANNTCEHLWRIIKKPRRRLQNIGKNE